MAKSKALFTQQCLQHVTVEEYHIHQISSILGGLPTAMDRFPQFVGGLRGANGASQGTPYQMFRDSLTRWKACNGEAATFGLIFAELNATKWTEAKEAILNIALDGLEQLQVKEQSVRYERVGAVLDIMLDDEFLRNQWADFADVLDIPRAKFVGEEHRYRNAQGADQAKETCRELLQTILNCWVQGFTGSNPRTVLRLSCQMTSMGRIETAERLVELLGTATVIVPQ